MENAAPITIVALVAVVLGGILERSSDGTTPDQRARLESFERHTRFFRPAAGVAMAYRAPPD